jgi:tetratricopeptide (TPR) repeat protein
MSEMPDEQNNQLLDMKILEEAISRISQDKGKETRIKLFNSFNVNIYTKDITAAEEACEAAVYPDVSKSGRSDAYAEIADALLLADELNSALLFYHKAIITDPENQKAWTKQGNYYASQGDYISAIACYIKTSATEIDMARCLHHLGWHDQALTLLEPLSPTEEEEEEYYFVKAACYYEKGDFQNACMNLTNITDEDSDIPIWHLSAQIAYSQGDDNRLIRALHHILPYWRIDKYYSTLSSKYFCKGEYQTWLKKQIPESGIYSMKKGEANLFLLASLISYRQKPDQISTRINTFLKNHSATAETIWVTIMREDINEWKRYPKDLMLHPDEKRHEMVYHMATYLAEYGGDGRHLWSGVTRGEVLRRLEEIGYKNTVTDFIIRSLAESEKDTTMKDDGWGVDHHLNRVLARMILGEETLPDNPEVITVIRRHFAEYDDLLHRIGAHHCRPKVQWCQNCKLSNICTSFFSKKRGGRAYLLYDDEEDEQALLKEGDEVLLVGRSIRGKITQAMERSFQEYLNLEYSEAFSAEIQPFYTLLHDRPIFIPYEDSLNVVHKKME